MKTTDEKTTDEAAKAGSSPAETSADDRDERVIKLTAEGQRRVAELLINPPEPSPGFIRAVEAHRRLIGEP